MTTVAIRILLTTIIVYYVYLETGPVTAFAIALMSLNSEITSVVLKNLREGQEAVCSALEHLARRAG